MKPTFFLLSLLVILVPAQGNAEHFKCDLTLNVIENTSSSEYKQLAFDIDLKAGLKNAMVGTMTTTTCFNTFIDPFNSGSSEFKKILIGDLIHGTLSKPVLEIGKNHYHFNLSFSQVANEQANDGVVTFIADGKILPLDNELYIHQNMVGECYLSEEPLILPKSVSLPDMDCGK